MAITLPTTSELSVFMRARLDDPAYAEEAILTGLDFFFIATGIKEDPEDEQELRILKRGIMAMAEAMMLKAPFRRLSISPFQSESLGSYTYSIAQKIAAREPTGVGFFDTAVDYFNRSMDLGFVTKVFESMDGLLFEDSDGNRHVFGPATSSELPARQDFYQQ